MQSTNQKFLIPTVAVALFLVPIGAVGIMNREQLRPYFVADAKTARNGELHYFARRG